MSQTEAAKRAGISRTSLVKVENELGDITERTRRALRTAFEAEGITFLPETGEVVEGIALRKAAAGRPSTG
jgi:transcriptional regulator with XRE-family HTH domain